MIVPTATIVPRHTGGRALTTGTPGGGVKRKVVGGDGGVGLLGGEGEAGERAVGLFDFDGGDGAVGGDGEGEAADAVLLALGLAGEGELAVGGGGELEAVELFFELGVAEEEAQRGAEVVELFGGDALDLGVAAGVEPGVFAVEQEELAGGGECNPTSCGRA